MLRTDDPFERSLLNSKVDLMVGKVQKLLKEQRAKRISDEILNKAIDLQIKEDEALAEEQAKRPDLY